jgi:hypothetical protein
VEKYHSYPQNDCQFFSLEHTDLYTPLWIEGKSDYKTGIYRLYLHYFVDNLCNCVEKHENNLVLRFLLLEGLLFLTAYCPIKKPFNAMLNGLKIVKLFFKKNENKGFCLFSDTKAAENSS